MSKLVILQKDNSIVGTDMYRSNDVTIANAFRPTLSHSINPNATGTNHQVTVKSAVPVLVTVAGVTTSVNTFVATLKFSSLQHITNDVERALAYDNLVAYMAKEKAAILAGILPDEPAIFA